MIPKDTDSFHFEQVPSQSLSNQRAKNADRQTDGFSALHIVNASCTAIAIITLAILLYNIASSVLLVTATLNTTQYADCSIRVYRSFSIRVSDSNVGRGYLSLV